MKRLCFPVVFLQVLLILLLSVPAAAAPAASRFCGGEGDGANLSWSYERETDTVTIRGSGPMRDYSVEVTIEEREYGGSIGYGAMNEGEDHDVWPPWATFCPRRAVVEEGVTSLGACAFTGIGELSEITLPSTLRTIGDYALAGTSVKLLAVPEGVSSLGDYACLGGRVNSVSLPSSLRSLGRRAFGGIQYNGRGLHIYYGGGDKDWSGVSLGAENGYLENADFHWNAGGFLCFDANGGGVRGLNGEPGGSMVSCALPAGGVLEVFPEPWRSGYVFDGWYTEKEGGEQVLPGREHVRNTALYAHWREETLGGPCGPQAAWSIDGNNVLTISGSGPTDEFDNGNRRPPWKDYPYTEVVVGEGITRVGSSAFSGGNGGWSLERVSFPSTLTSIGDYAFLSCSSLTRVILPDGLEEIGPGAFSGCTKLNTVFLPASVRTIGEKAFYRSYERLDRWRDDAASVFYEGTEADWNRLIIGADNGLLGASSDIFYGAPAGGTCYVGFVRNAPTGSGNRGAAVYSAKGTLPSLPPEPARTGCRFAGWYTDPVWGDPVTEDTEFAGDTLVYAHWTFRAEGVPASPLEETVLSGMTGLAGNREVERNLAYTRIPYGFTCAEPVRTWLLEDGDSFLALDANDYTGVLTLTSYDRSFRQLERREVPYELPKLGGFYAGENGWFIVFGQYNPEEDDQVEVIRIVRYDKELNRQAALSLRGCFTRNPFESGTLSMAEDQGRLFVHTCRLLYTTYDGKNHQASLTLEIDTATMTLLQALGGTEMDYHQKSDVSHSFYQSVWYDRGRPVLVDLGDGGPRGVALQRQRADGETYDGVLLHAVPGRGGLNWTGVRIGDCACGENAYLVLVNALDRDAQEYRDSLRAPEGYRPIGEQRDVVLLLCRKDSLEPLGITAERLTDFHGSGRTAGIPRMVSLGDDRFALLWEEYTYLENGSSRCDGVRWVIADGNGVLLTAPALLSDGQLPTDEALLLSGDALVWFVDHRASGDQEASRVFYRLALPQQAETNVIRSVIPDGGSPQAELACARDGATAFCGAYDGTGRQIASDVQTLPSGWEGVCTFRLDREDYASLRVFLLDPAGRPLCPAKTAGPTS